jgi:HPt (histidine-containing phosphotransfer) domain-containing protein
MSRAVVLALKPKENPRLDLEQISSIYRNLSAQAAEQVVARALGELALQMAKLAERIAAHQMGDLLRRLKRLDRMAQNLGLKTLSMVAQDLATCLEREDATAFAAVWARLLRVADCTLQLDQGLQDQTGV